MYKKGQGSASRIGVAALLLAVGIYAGHCWYYWLSDPEASGWGQILNAGFLGSLVLFVGTAGLGLYLAFVQPKSSDFLIDMDGELRKVVWPAVNPLFDPKAEAWGSTYVVIVCTAILTVFIWAVDWVLQTATGGLYGWLFS